MATIFSYKFTLSIKEENKNAKMRVKPLAKQSDEFEKHCVN